MKKIFFALGAAALFAACNSADSTASTVTTDQSVAIVDSPPPPVVAEVLYVPAEGDVMLQNGRVMVYNNNTWEAAKSDVTLENGVVVSNTGVVKRTGETETVTLSEGESVNKSGNFFDKAGHGISTGWQKTKEGVSTAAEKTADAAKDAGQAIGKGAKKAAKKTKEFVTGDKKED